MDIDIDMDLDLGPLDQAEEYQTVSAQQLAFLTQCAI